MYNKSITNLFDGYKTEHDIFHDLMKYRVRKILLVASLYDAFILQGEGSLYEQIYGEYDQLNLSSVPVISSVDNEEKAIEKLKNEHFDLVLLMEGIHLENPERLSRQIRGVNKTIPILLLLNNSRVATFLSLENRPKDIDRIFVWNGDAKIFLAMIKYIEDKHNLERDTRNGEVRVILLIEDSIPYYSRYIPIFYTEIMQQTQYLMNKEKMDGINKLLRMRVRPKVILVSNYEDAEDIYHRYRESMLCVISDVEYMKNGKSDDRAGIRFIKHLKKDGCDVPFLLQSSASVDLAAEDLHGVSFIDKNSSELAGKLKKFIKTKLGFGEFVFRDRDGREVARANTLEKFTSYLTRMPHETLLHHSAGNDFSTWLMARGEIHFAKQMRQMQISDFESVESLRDFMLNTLTQGKSKNRRDETVWFDKSPGQEHAHLLRLSTGSLGGKGRGIAFSHSLIERLRKSDGTRIKVTVPDTAIIGTDEFEMFMAANSISDIVERDEGYQP
ncbi:pyruvate, phosphate dikinase, partial [bacterium]|nr:pyruvate, phosphate dikinase [bacterium]